MCQGCSIDRLSDENIELKSLINRIEDYPEQAATLIAEAKTEGLALW